ncbi:MAG: glycine betaine ABC transporter substrate-binding protein [Thermomicrobiales bacterium]
MQTISRRTAVKGSIAAAAALTLGRAEMGFAQEPIRVGSKDFAESIILGEMYALLLEDAGLSVERKLNLGGTVIAHESLLAGELDIYPEYTGTGLLVVLGSTVEAALEGGDGTPAAEASPVSDTAGAVYAYVRDQYKEQFDLVWLEPTPMSNSQALAVQRSFAEEHGLTTISDLVALAGDVDLVFSAPVDFEEREDGLLGLRRVYGDFEATVNGVAPGIKYQALMDGDANVVLAFSTDAEIAINDLVVLTDDLELWPPYNVSPVVRQAAIDANPSIPDILNPLAPIITNEVMSQLNGAVIGEDGQEPETVARDFMIEQGLIAAG